MSANRKIVMVGAGNVGTRLATALYRKKFNIMQVYSRTMQSAKELASQVGAEAIDDLNKLDMDKYTYILALPDDVVVSVLPRIKIKDGILVHCSGSLPMEILQNSANKYGIIYPLISMTKGRDIDFEGVPMCVEGSELGVQFTLSVMCKYLSKNTSIVDSEKRKILHLAAVFANNFPNYLYIIAKDILEKNNIEFDLIKPLICETALNVNKVNPLQCQTGPAVRNDKQIIEKHLSLLSDFPEYKEFYQLFTDKIIAKDHWSND